MPCSGCSALHEVSIKKKTQKKKQDNKISDSEDDENDYGFEKQNNQEHDRKDDENDDSFNYKPSR